MGIHSFKKVYIFLKLLFKPMFNWNSQGYDCIFLGQYFNNFRITVFLFLYRRQSEDFIFTLGIVTGL